MLRIRAPELAFLACALCAGQTVDDLLATCPTAAEISAFDKDLKMSFEFDPTVSEGLACHASDGSADLTRLQKQVYQALRVMKRLQFDVPLPWTTSSFYDWFAGSIVGMRFRDIPANFCCDPKGVINIPSTTRMAYLTTDRWFDPATGPGLESLVSVEAHEARHVAFGPHTCGPYDTSISELGSDGVQYYLEEWLAFHSPGDFWTPLEYPHLSKDFYRNGAWGRAQGMRDSVLFCDKGNGVAISHEKDFGIVAVGFQGPLHTIAVTATTPNPVSIAKVELAGDSPDDFLIAADGCSGKTVPPSCVVLVKFWPSQIGTRTADLVVTDTAGNTHQTTFAGTGNDNVPMPAVDRVVNAASYAPDNEIVAGGIISVFGKNLARETASAVGASLPVTLAGASVVFNGIPAHLSYASSEQLNVQVPWEVAGLSQAMLTVTVMAPQGVAANSFALNVVDGQPAIFTANGQGNGQGSILIAGSTSVAAPLGTFPGSRPVRRGEYLEVYATGLGLVTNGPPNGTPASASPLSETLASASATINNIPAHVSFSGLAPGIVGLYQVNVEITEGVASGNTVPLTLSIGGKTSNVVTIAVE